MSRVQTCSLSETDVLKLYNALDDDGNGLLDEDELKVLMRKLGMPESYAKLCMIFVAKGKTQINFKNFKDFLAILLLYKADKPKFLDLVFECMDQDSSGRLDLKEVFIFLRILGIECTVQQAIKILHAADEDSNMELDKKEFATLVEALEQAMD